MIPLRDVIPSRTTPVVVLMLIALHALVFLSVRTATGGEIAGVAGAWGLVPADVSLTGVLGSMVLHAGWLQLLPNMLCLWIFGDNVEDRMGHGRFLVFYLLCGLLAASVHVAVSPGSARPALGSSGALAGVMGGYFVLYPNSRVLTLVPVVLLVETPAVLYLAVWFVLQVVIGVGFPLSGPWRGRAVGGLAFWSLVAGFAAGAALVLLFRRPERVRVEWWSDLLGSRADRM
jgi:membrane associated rhomboid family serine protease